MTNGMTQCFLQSESPADAAERAATYLRRLGYKLDDRITLWLTLMACKIEQKRWPASEFGRRVMKHVYNTAGWPPNSLLGTLERLDPQEATR